MMSTQGMGIYNVIVILQVVLGLAKEIFIVAFLFQLIRIATMYIKKHKDKENPVDMGETYQSNSVKLERAEEEDNIDNTDNTEE